MLLTLNMKAFKKPQSIASEIILKEGLYKFHLMKTFQLSAMVVIMHHSHLLTAPTLEMLLMSLKPYISN